MFKRASYLFLASLIVFLLFTSLASPAQAAKKRSRSYSRTSSTVNTYNPYKEPNFPRCPDPSGEQVAGYSEGWHWIVGESILRWGSDYVFAQKEGNYVQCFCAKALKEGDDTFIHGGIQTNWLRVATVDSGLKDWLLTKGWILVPNGADFGLSAEPYLAKNLSYACDNSCVIKQENKTTVDVTINENAETGKNTANSNTEGSVEVQTGNIFNFTGVEIFGGTNSVN